MVIHADANAAYDEADTVRFDFTSYEKAQFIDSILMGLAAVVASIAVLILL